MKTNFTLRSDRKMFLLLLCFGAVSFSVSAQLKDPSRKIDPAFKPLFEQQAGKLLQARVQNVQLGPVVNTATPAVANKADRYECIVYTTNAQALSDSGIIMNSRLPKFVTAMVTLDEMNMLSNMDAVSYIEAPIIDKLHNDIALASTGAALLQASQLNNTMYKGKGVITAIYDSGIDWDHPDFRDPQDTTKSRILRIWDQTLTATGAETPPTGYSYGVEYTQAQLNDELDGTPAGVVRERDFNGHGSHVAGTVAGNGAAKDIKYAGMAPEADIVIIKGGEGSFSESRIIDGITYLKNLSTILGKPVVLNMSLGGQSGAHDGTRAYELAVDDFTTSAPGRVVVISAGNDNGTAIHRRNIINAGATGTTTIAVNAGVTGNDVFQHTMYCDNTNNISVKVTAPDGSFATANYNQSVATPVLSDSFRVSITAGIYALNSKSYVNVYVTRVSPSANRRSPAGNWVIELTNNGASPVTVDGWLNYRNDVFAATAVVGGDNEFLVGSPGNATTAITVGSYVARPAWYSPLANGNYSYSGTTVRVDSISTFSAHGPRRDGLMKPDITAHGQAVVSVLSSDSGPAASDVVVTGLYRKNQGTSMSAPVTAGAVALLMQVYPAATAAEIKAMIKNTAVKDRLTEIPGASPNSTYGSGKLDVFKAAATAFTCAPPDRKTYQYDYSQANSSDAGVSFTTQRIAVKVTPDISGKVAGIYYHPSTTNADLIAEIRTNNAGTPGDLLGMVNVPLASATGYSWNYVDFSNLKIPVITASDFFVVVYRNPSSTSGWSLRRETVAIDNRSLSSSNDGASWSVIAADYKIRAVVFEDGQSAITLATSNVSNTLQISANNQFVNNCKLIAAVKPEGAEPVSGTVTGKVWIEPSVPAFGTGVFVARHYEITPASGAATATGKVTLYFTQAEFNSFNDNPGSMLNLPANATDAAGKANLRVAKYAGSSSDNTGLPGTYSGSPLIIDPADEDIIWNSTFNRWEITLTVTGFSGFIVQSQATPLPIVVEYFNGQHLTQKNVLNWKVNCSAAGTKFEVLRSADGNTFSTIGKVAALSANCAEALRFEDESPLGGNNFYRIKAIEQDGKLTYTNIILLGGAATVSSAVYPTVLSGSESLKLSFSGLKGTFIVRDVAGKEVRRQAVSYGIQTIALPKLAAGVYHYTLYSDSEKLTGKIVIQ